MYEVPFSIFFCRHPAGKHDDAVDVYALIGLALDQTNPGNVPNPYQAATR